MIKVKYYKDNEYRAELLLLDSETIGSFTGSTLQDVVDKCIKFEEEFYHYKFRDKERELKYKNAELLIRLNAGEELVLDELFEINKELQVLYMKNGFDMIRSKYKYNYLNVLENEEVI